MIVYVLFVENLLYQKDMMDEYAKYVKYAVGCKTVASKGGQEVRKIKQTYKVCTECGKQFRTQSKNDYTLCILNIDSVVLAKQKAVINAGYKCWFLTEKNWDNMFSYLQILLNSSAENCGCYA